MKTLLIIILTFSIGIEPAWAATEINLKPPAKTSAPPKISREAPEEPYRCQRIFTFEGKTLGCDSFLANDGEKLRPFLKDLPDATLQLNSYQQTRRNVQLLAFSATAGILLWIAASTVKDNLGGLEGIAIRNRYGIPGLTLFAGSIMTGWIMLSSNENKLQNAIGIHNQAHPENPIQVQVNTQLRF